MYGWLYVRTDYIIHTYVYKSVIMNAVDPFSKSARKKEKKRASLLD